MKKMSVMLSAIVLCAGMLFSVAAYANNSREADYAAADAAFKAKVIENIGHGKLVYFAAPMFSANEREYNLKVTKVLEEFGYKVFLPQRDGIEAARLDGKTEEELVKMIFPLDVGEVKKADILFMNIDGRAPDEGACVELGIAYAAGKRCYGFKTDPRTVELRLEMNPMISGCMIKTFKNYDGDKMIEELRQYLSKNAL